MRRLSFFAFVIFFCAPLVAHAAPLEVGGWIPYWRTATGTADVLPHLSQLTAVQPFVLTLGKDGSIIDEGKFDQEPWLSFKAQARAQKVRVIPTIMSGDGATIHTLLSNTQTRIALEDAITAWVYEHDVDGIDIDFEGKYAETRDYFTTFLKGLYQRMGPKWVYCTIEARTPLADRFSAPPKTVAFANDLAKIHRYCDRVHIMAYDQGSIDLTLNAARAKPYIPLADPAWVEKSVRLMMESIPKRKIILGVATYGYEYAVTPLATGGYRYDRQWGFNPRYASALAAQLGLTPIRNAAGELSLMYKPGTVEASKIETGLVGEPVQPKTPDTLVGPGSALYGQSAFGAQAATFNLLWWSDAQAVNDKIELAKRLGLRGVSVFKFDGGEDQGIWNLFPNLR